MNTEPHKSRPASHAGNPFPNSGGAVIGVDAALELAGEYGIPVFPCGDNKKPLTKRGFKDATTDKDQITRWWSSHPEALVGVPTGAVSGLLVIDVDPAGIDFVFRNDNCIDGGRQHNTRRGSHFLFRAPVDQSIRCSAGKIAEGVDVRCEGGYIIWWPAAGLGSFGPEIDKLPLPSDSLLCLLNGPSSAKSSDDEAAASQPRLGLRLTDLANMLQAINPDAGYENWLKVLMAAHHETGGSHAGFELVDDWSAQGKKYKGTEDVRSHWRSFRTDRTNIVGAAWLRKFSAEQTVPWPSSVSDNGQRFVVLPDHQFVDRAPLSWHVKGVLPRGELAVVFGPSGCGKSFLVFDMVAAISAGRDWQGRKTTKGKAVFLLAEGAMGFRNRLLAYAKVHGGCFPGVHIIDAAPNLLGEQDHLLLAKQIEACGGVDIIIIDTLAASSAGADENAGKDMGRVIEHCKMLHKMTSATVLLIHHSGKDESKGARGWSGLRAAADAEIEVSKNGDQRAATVTKLKDGEDGLKFGFKLVPVDIGIDPDGDPVRSCVVESEALVPGSNPKEPRPGTIERTLLELMRDDPSFEVGISTPTLTDALEGRLPKPAGRDTRKQHIKRAFLALEAKGFIAIEGELCRVI